MSADLEAQMIHEFNVFPDGDKGINLQFRSREDLAWFRRIWADRQIDHAIASDARKQADAIREVVTGDLRPGESLISAGIPVLIAEVKRLRAENEKLRPTVRPAAVMQLVDGFPRRNKMDHWTPMERAIHDAHQVIERGPAHPLLTEAGQLLLEAREKVADFVELPPPDPSMIYRRKPVAVDAVQWMNNGPAIINWIGHNKAHFDVDRNRIVIKTEHGDTAAYPRDWITKDEKGAYRTWKPEAFGAAFQISFEHRETI